MKKRRVRKLCLAASAGGHLQQLLLLEPIWRGSDVFCVSTGTMVRARLELIGRTYIVGECNREHPFKTMAVTIRCLRIIMKERPSIVLSTGAAVGFLTSFWGWFTGADVVWVDSIANVERLSLSGRLVRYFADLVLTQWPDVAVQYRNVEYAGELI